MSGNNKPKSNICIYFTKFILRLEINDNESI